MPSAIQTYTMSYFDPYRLCLEVLADPGISTQAKEVDSEGNNVQVVFVDEISTTELSALNALISVHELEQAKIVKKKAIDDRTDQLIEEGFVYDNETFSFSKGAQLNWIGLEVKKSSLTWPVNVSTKENGEYSLAQADLGAFTDVGMATKQAHLDSGRALKQSVNSATTVAAVEAVEDNR